jgi:hypothetical protein
MKRRLLTLLGISVLLGGGLNLVVLMTGEPPPGTEAEAGITAEPAAVPAAPPAVTEAPRPPPWAAAAARSTTAPPSWKPEVKDPSAPGKADRATRKVVRKALLTAPVEEELARCVEHDREVWFGGSWASSEPIPHAKPAILTLRLETLGRQVKIADVQVKSWGGASRATVTCARNVLLGTVVPVASSGPAGPMQMTFLLSPRNRAVATAG